MRILLLNGPNLNLLGTRRPEVYGDTTLAEVEQRFRGWADALGVEHVETAQSNHEGVLIDRIHQARTDAVDGIVFNPGAHTHTSYALHDAVEAVEIPTVETHISNVEEREAWRRTSLIRPACVHTVYGRGVDGYRWALRHLVIRLTAPAERLSYGPEDQQFIDLRLPSGDGPAPLVVLVHGGFWKHHWTFDTVERIAAALADAGVASAVVEYRRVGRAGGGGGGRASIQDVRAAVRQLLADPRIDAQRWAIAGHSAGAQLALTAIGGLTSVDPAAPAERTAPGATATLPRPALAVALGGVTDLTAAITDGLGQNAAAAYLGPIPADQLSPVELAPFGTPLLIAHGRDDASVPFSQSEHLAARAEAAGDTVELLPHDGGHFEFVDPEEPAWQAVQSRLLTALS